MWTILKQKKRFSFAGVVCSCGIVWLREEALRMRARERKRALLAAAIPSCPAVAAMVTHHSIDFCHQKNWTSQKEVLHQTPL